MSNYDAVRRQCRTIENLVDNKIGTYSRLVSSNQDDLESGIVSERRNSSKKRFICMQRLGCQNPPKQSSGLDENVDKGRNPLRWRTSDSFNFWQRFWTDTFKAYRCRFHPHPVRSFSDALGTVNVNVNARILMTSRPAAQSRFSVHALVGWTEWG